MYKLFLALLFVPSIALANPIDDKCPQFSFEGAPISSITKNDDYLCKQNYAIHYREDTKTPEYVVEHPTKDAVSGPAKRKDNFRPDPDVPKAGSATLADYSSEGSTYDRGHMVPAGDNTQSVAIMSESFFLTNMVPQVGNNNRGIWKQLETAVRNWVLEGKNVYVSSGSIYDAGYKSIGPGKVGVPTRLFKVIFDVTDNRAIGFIFPNTALDVKDLPKYAVSIEAVERVTGIKFAPKLATVAEKTVAPDLTKWSSLK